MNAARFAFAFAFSSLMLVGSLVLAHAAGAQEIDVRDDTSVRAREAFDQIAESRLDRSTLTSDFNDLMTPEVRAAQTDAATLLGKPSQFFPIAQVDQDGTTTTVFRIRFPKGYLDLTFGIDDKINKIDKLYFTAGPAI